MQEILTFLHVWNCIELNFDDQTKNVKIKITFRHHTKEALFKLQKKTTKKNLRIFILQRDFFVNHQQHVFQHIKVLIDPFQVLRSNNSNHILNSIQL